MQLWKSVSSLFILLMIVLLASAQEQLTVEGDANIIGRLNIHAGDDTTSLYIGKDVGSAPTRSFHTIVGVRAGMNMTGSPWNSFVGYETGANSFGGSNCFFGYQAGMNNDGASNTIYGYRSGENNEGSSNAFFGSESGKDNTGEYNAFFGAEAGWANITGEENTFLGYDAGSRNETGSFNTFVGTYAGQKDRNNNVDRSIAIGYRAKANCSNCAIIGGQDVNAVMVGIGTDTPDAYMHIVGNSGITPHVRLHESEADFARIRMTNSVDSTTYWDIAGRPSKSQDQSTAQLNFYYNESGNILRLFGDGDATLTGNLAENSDQRLKTNMVRVSNVLSNLLIVHGYRYQWKNKSNADQQIGFLAQEVQKVFPELVQADHEGILSVNYTRFVPILLEALREQQRMIDQQRHELDSLTSQVSEVLSWKHDIEQMLTENASTDKQ